MGCRRGLGWGKDASDSAPLAWSGAKGSKDAWDNAPPAWSGAKGKGGKDIAPDKLNKYMGYTSNKFVLKLYFPCSNPPPPHAFFYNLMEN